MGQSDEDSPTADRAARAKLVMDAVQAAATSADPVVRVDAPSVPGQGWTSADVTLTIEIRVACLPGGLVTAFPTYWTTDGLISEDPPFVLDPANPQASLTLAAEVERLFARVGGNLEAWQVRVTEPGLPTGLPVDEPWLERPSHSAVLERIRAVRTGRGGEVAIAIVEAPCWVVRLSVGGRPGDLEVEGSLIDRVVRIDRSHHAAAPLWHGSWRLRGESPELSPMLNEITRAILAQAPEAAEAGGPTTAVRLEQNASARGATDSLAGTVGAAWLCGWVLALALWFRVTPTTGFFGLITDPIGAILGIILLTLPGTIPALAAGDVAMWAAERRRARWSAERAIRTAAIWATYAAWFAAVSLLPNWGAVLVLTVCGGIGWALLEVVRRRRAGRAQV